MVGFRDKGPARFPAFGSAMGESGWCFGLATPGLRRHERTAGVKMVMHSVNVNGDQEKGVLREPHRRTAIVVGVLLIVCSVASVLSVAPLGSMLDSPVDLTRLAVNDDRVVLAALIEFVWAATGAGIAIVLYPMLRHHGRAMAFGAAAARVVEGVLILVGTLSLLALLTLAQESLRSGWTDNASTDASVQVLLAVREWVPSFMILLPFLLGAGMYYYLMYRSTIVPRWLSIWGLLAVALSFVATLYSGFTQEFGFTTLNTALNIPIGLQEMVLAVWLIAKGFNRVPEFPAVESRA